MHKIVIIGTGALATALAQIITDNSPTNQVVMYGIDEQEILEINNFKTNQRYFKNIILNNNITATNLLNIAVIDAKTIIIATPNKVFSQIIDLLNNYLQNEVVIINASKGFNNITNECLTTSLRNINMAKIYGSIYGPGFAEEIIKKSPTFMMSVSTQPAFHEYVKNNLTTPYFKIRCCYDTIGADVGAACKNVLAIMAGMLAKYSKNIIAGLWTAGLNEMKDLALTLGGKADTFLTLVGVGDLFLTTTSSQSRNFILGTKLAEFNQFSKINNFTELPTTTEGVDTCRLIYENLIIDAPKSEFPIFQAIYNILYHDRLIDKTIIELYELI